MTSCVCGARGYCADAVGDPLACEICLGLGDEQDCPADVAVRGARARPVPVDPLEAAAAELAAALAALRRCAELLAEARIAHRDARLEQRPAGRRGADS
jgi:hypothetical protein